MNRIGLSVLLAAGVPVAGCGERTGDTGREPPANAAAAPAATADAPAGADSTVFTERVVVLLQASAAALDSLREARSPEDYYVMADDMMFYRSGVYDLVEERGLPFRSFNGRLPLQFMVDGSLRQYDFSDVTWLDVVVLYEPGQEPRVMAPIEFPLVVDEYF